MVSVRGPVGRAQSVPIALLVVSFSSLMIAEKALKLGAFESPDDRAPSAAFGGPQWRVKERGAIYIADEITHAVIETPRFHWS